jgi:hypothetical protein
MLHKSKARDFQYYFVFKLFLTKSVLLILFFFFDEYIKSSQKYSTKTKQDVYWDFMQNK